MKNQSFYTRVGFALSGLRRAIGSEHSFRFQLTAAGLVIALLLWLRPAPVWWAVISLTLGAVLATELLNTAIEALADLVQPAQDERIRIIKDCAAAAVLVAATSSVAVAIAFLCNQLL
jgi:diacylglycerol kinase (ATP)